MRHPLRLVLGLALVIGAGCKADDPNPGGDGDKRDAGTGNVLAPPVLESVPATTPLTTVAIRGTTNGTRIVAQGTAEGSKLSAVLPGGSFCLDGALDSGAPTDMRLYAVGGDGRISEPVDVQVTRDVGASEPANPTCSGTGQIDCDGPEMCANEKDDDCNGYADNCDVACNGCGEDLFEPNDVAIDVPIIPAGTHTLQLCPCRDDWFAFERDNLRRIQITATFNNANIDIDLRLYRAGPGGQGQGDQVASSVSVTGIEEIDYSAQGAGLYYLRVYSLTNATQDISYQLVVN